MVIPDFFVIYNDMRQHLFEADYGPDYIEWIKFFEEQSLQNIINSGKNKDSYNQKLEEVQENIIKDGDSSFAYFFACDIGYKNYQMQNVILKAKEPKYVFLFAQNIKNADISALQSVILESKNIKYICKFGCFVPDASISKIEAMVLNEKKPKAKYAHMLIKHVPGVNINKFRSIILKSKKPRYLFELAKHVTSKKDLELIEDLLIECKSKTYIKMLAEKIKGANIEKLEQAVLDLDDPERIKKFAKYVRKSSLRNFLITL